MMISTWIWERPEGKLTSEMDKYQLMSLLMNVVSYAFDLSAISNVFICGLGYLHQFLLQMYSCAGLVLEDGVARGDEALGLLENGETRQGIKEELEEVCEGKMILSWQ